MGDLVERLRTYTENRWSLRNVCNEAADEVERLRAQLEYIRGPVPDGAASEVIQHLRAVRWQQDNEIERLREALRRLKMMVEEDWPGGDMLALVEEALKLRHEGADSES